MRAWDWRAVVVGFGVLMAGCSAVGNGSGGGFDSRGDSEIGVGKGRAGWMGEARWGLFTHYLADWKSREMGVEITPERWNEMVDKFDVEGLADQLKGMGVKYYFLTIGQNSGYYCSPNATYERIVGPTCKGKLSRRDLIADVGAALQKRGIHFCVYLPSGAPAGDKVAREKLGWVNGAERNAAFQRNWEAVIREWSLRWGDKVEGWWFDGCYFPNTMYRYPEAPNFRSFAAAARAGNPRAAVGFNPGPGVRAQSMTPYEDFTAGECTNPDKFIARRMGADGTLDGVQPHILTYIGASWGHGPTKYPDEFVEGFVKKITRTGMAVTFDVAITVEGRIDSRFEHQIGLIRKVVEETGVEKGSESGGRGAAEGGTVK
ncbi:MAG: alpha-L-fucosidase [Phycisphaerae bacterium]